MLKEYLENREAEIVDIMMTLFDEEKIMKNYVADERKEAARKTAERLIKKAQMSLEDIADCCTELSLDEIREIKAEIM